MRLTDGEGRPRALTDGAGLALVPTDGAGLPACSPTVRARSACSPTVRALPSYSPTVRALPSCSPTVPARSAGSPTVRALPSCSPTVRALPSRSPTVRALPSRSPTVHALPSCSQTVRASPRAHRRCRPRPRAHRRCRPCPRAHRRCGPSPRAHRRCGPPLALTDGAGLERPLTTRRWKRYADPEPVRLRDTLTPAPGNERLGVTRRAVTANDPPASRRRFAAHGDLLAQTVRPRCRAQQTWYATPCLSRQAPRFGARVSGCPGNERAQGSAYRFHLVVGLCERGATSADACPHQGAFLVMRWCGVSRARTDGAGLPSSSPLGAPSTQVHATLCLAQPTTLTSG
jgi:hypothetical protein